MLHEWKEFVELSSFIFKLYHINISGLASGTSKLLKDLGWKKADKQYIIVGYMWERLNLLEMIFVGKDIWWRRYS